ncbi:MAG: glycosyltransferase family 2 protein [Thermoplasmata archaeon]|nr:glycosyltransferase family 2 protein [Thermoplasmata archaeon]
MRWTETGSRADLEHAELPLARAEWPKATRAGIGSEVDLEEPTPLHRPAHLPNAAASGSRLLILPTLNEEEGLGLTLAEFASTRFVPEASRPVILVVDGHSTDGTGEVARSHGVRLLLQDGRGKGSAVREGLSWALRNGFQTVAVMDADATYPAGALPALFDLLEAHQDVVIGVRKAPPLERASLRDLVHRVGNGLLNYAAAQLSGKSLLDVCSGFWGVRVSTLDRLALCSDGFEIESELFIKSFRRGLRVAQIPVQYGSRAGTAKLRAFRDGSRILLSIFRQSVRQPRRPTPQSARDFTADPLALVLGLGPERVLLLSAPERVSDADRIADRIATASPSAEVTTALLPEGARDSFDGHLLSALVAPSVGEAAPTVVTFLPSSGNGYDLPVFVGIPRTQRLLCLAPRSDRRVHGEPAELAARMGFRNERTPSGRLGAWFVLAAILERSGTHRELALLKANAGDAPMQSFRKPSPLTLPGAGRWSRVTVPYTWLTEAAHRLR